MFWSQLFSPGAHRLVYFSAFSGDAFDFHEARKSIRNFGLEPNIYHEPSDLRKQRQNLLDSGGVIEKAKQVDIGLSVRALQDVHADVFDECHIYTSDVDFIPLIQALRARGPTVKVFGYNNGLGNLSELETIPDQFIDLTDFLANHFDVGEL
ncbi:MAG: NYN domain-containing protein [Pirellulaceae bacterium]